MCHQYKILNMMWKNLASYFGKIAEKNTFASGSSYVKKFKSLPILRATSSGSLLGNSKWLVPTCTKTFLTDAFGFRKCSSREVGKLGS